MQLFLMRWKLWISHTAFLCAKEVINSNSRFSAESAVLDEVEFASEFQILVEMLEMHVFLFRGLWGIYFRGYRNCYRCLFCASSVLCPYLSISDLNSLSRLICPLLHVQPSSEFFSGSSFQSKSSYPGSCLLSNKLPKS